LRYFFIILSLAGAVTLLFLGSFSFAIGLGKKDRLNRIFTVYALFLAYWAFNEFLYRQADSFRMAYIWMKEGFLWPLGLSLFIHFCLIFTENTRLLRSKITWFFLYAPAIFISALHLMTDLLQTNPVMEYWGYTYVQQDNIFYDMTIAWAFIMALLGPVICWAYFLRLKAGPDKKKTQQAKYVAIGVLFPTIFGTLTEVIIPWFSNIRVPEMTMTALTVEGLFIIHAIRKYELFMLTPQTAAENIISTMTGAMILIDPEARVTRANRAAARLLGYDKEEGLVGMSFGDIFASDEELDVRAMVDNLRVKNEFRDKEMYLRASDNRRIPVLFNASVIRDKNNALLGIVCIANDITERKKAEAELKNAYEQLKDAQSQLVQTAKMASVGTLAGGVAHEINNPLTGVLNNVQLIKMMAGRKKDFDMNDFRELLDVIEQSAGRCKKITQSLLAFSRSSKGLFQAVSLNKIVEDVLVLAGYELELQNIVIKKDFQSDLPDVLGDPQLLQQVVLDIISNAKWAIRKKGGKENGRIDIMTRHEKGQKDVYLYVSDNGIGITENNMAKIFEPFFTTKDVGEGTGLGLSIVYSIIRAHNGVIEAEGASDKGATFKIRLPAA